ncbi:hypothetical protein NDU88_002197 [Pleurodeles waltl]|uniref:Uncharacterized protein n=1 Tax=Pleurodeles waltl TaxID=8319 RepID=A0AAV7P9A0_PLEWA|nr:hypothetical protein NDU88_002197 [Pleurodeles waltl]
MRFPAGSRPCSCSSPLRPRPAQLRATRYSDVQFPTSQQCFRSPLTAIDSSCASGRLVEGHWLMAQNYTLSKQRGRSQELN